MRLALFHPDWEVGFSDEVWWSRLAQPAMRAWTLSEPLRLLEKARDKGDTERKAIGCYGLLRPDRDKDEGKMLLRFVDGRPVSQVTCDFLAWVLEQLAQEGKKALFLVWDNATWHGSGIVKKWIKEHNRKVKREGGVRLIVCPLPVKSPWLNPIEVQWMHGKRAIAEPARTLTADELIHRICRYFHSPLTPPITQNAA